MTNVPRSITEDDVDRVAHAEGVDLRGTLQEKRFPHTEVVSEKSPSALRQRARPCELRRYDRAVLGDQLLGHLK